MAGDRIVGAPGHEHVMGNQVDGQAWTVIRFADKSSIRVHWDGQYEVAGMHGDDQLTIYCPSKRRLHFSWRIIDMVEHQERQDDDE